MNFKRILFLTILLAFCINYTFGQSSSNHWTNGIGGTLLEDGRSVTSDANNNVYATGAFMGTVDFDPGPGITNVSSAGDKDIYLVKYDAQGNLLWVKTFGSSWIDISNKVMIDNAGNILLYGIFTGTVDFNPGAGVYNVTSVMNSIDLFILKLNNDGDFIWVKTIGEAGNEYAGNMDIETISSNQIVLTGKFIGVVDFDPGPGTFNMSAIGQHDLFVLKLQPNGDFIFAREFNTNNTAFITDVKIDNFHNIYVTGGFKGTMDFDPGAGVINITSYGDFDIFVCKLNSAGNYLLGHQMGSPSDDFSNSIAVVKNTQEYFITGHFSGTIDFDPGPGTNNVSLIGNKDAYVAKYGASGTLMWVRRLDGAGDKSGISIEFDNALGLYVVGKFNNTISYQPNPAIISNGYDDGFVFKLRNDNGSFLSSYKIGGPLNDRINQIHVIAPDVHLLTGNYTGTVDFDPGPLTVNLTSQGSHINSIEDDAFVTKYCGTYPSFIISNTPNSGICKGQNVTLSCNSTLNSYLWNTGDTTQSINVNANYGVNSYTLTGTGDYGCRRTLTHTFTANDSAYIMPATATICLGQSITLTAFGGGSYLWNTGATTASITVNPTVDTTYTVNIISTNGCTTTVTRTVNVNPLPNGNISPLNPSICNGNNITLTASGGSSYLWNTSATTASITVNPTTNTNYTVTVFNSNGCSTNVSTQVNVINNSIAITQQPSSIIACSGDSATFNISANGTGCTYQWKKNGVNIPGATSTSYTISNVSASDVASYTVVITDSCGFQVTSNVATLSLTNNYIPVTNGLVFYIPFDGNNNELVQSATNYGLYSYSAANDRFGTAGKAAYFNGNLFLKYDSAQNIPSGNNPYTISVWINVNSGYWFNTTGICGWGSNSSNQANRLRLSHTPVVGYRNYWWSNDFDIATAPTTGVWKHVVVTWDGTTQRSYENGNLIASRTPSQPNVVGISNVNPLYVGASFTSEKFFGMLDDFRIYNRAISSSEVNELYNFQPLSVGNIPSTQTLCAGQTLNVSSTITGSSPITYQWLYNSNPISNGGNISGATSNSLTINNLLASQSGNYQLQVTQGGCSQVTTNTMALTVNTNSATFTTHPQSQSICVGQSFTLSASLSGTVTSYQWYKNSNPITGATSATYNVNNAQLSDSGVYYVVATTLCGNVTSQNATITINNSTITITQQPISQLACLGSSVTFSVAANGTSLTYQWTKNNVNIPGANASTYTINNINAGDVGNYNVIINGSCSSSVTSNNATLNITTTFNPVSSGLIFYLPFDGNVNEQIQNSANIGTYTYASANDRFGVANKAAQFNGTSRLEFANPSQLPTGNSSFSISVWINIPVGQWTNANGICGWGNETNHQSNRLRLSSTGYVNYWWANDFNISASPAFNTWKHIVVTWDGTTQRFYENGIEIGSRVPSTAPNVSLTNLFVGATGVSFFGGEPFNGVMDDFRIYNRAITASEVNELFVFQPLSAVTLPSTLSLCEGQTFSPTASFTGNGSLTYQWLYNSNPLTNGGNVSGATSTSLQINNLTTANSGNYQLVVTQGNCISETSNSLALTVNPNTVNISSQPQSLTVCEGQTATFNASVTGTVTSYQWYKNGNPISGATTNSLVINNVQTSDQGNYTLEITTTCGSVTTNPATLTVNPNTAITQQPQFSGNLCIGNSFTLSVTAVGASSYQWYLNGNSISGATAATYTVTNAQTSNSGNYTVEVINAGCGSNVTSNIINVTLETQPVITSNLVGGNYCEGEPMTLQIQVSNTATSYHWWQNGNNIAITSTPVYNVPSVTSSDQGAYTVVAYNSCGGTNAQIVNVTVNPTYAQSIQQTLCYGDSFTFGSSTYNQSGTYTQNYQTINGCDSIYTIQIDVLPEIITNQSATICDGQQYQLGSQTLTTSGTYTEVLTANNGCDSTVVLQLTVITSSTVFNQTASICQGDVYTFGSLSLTNAGTYNQTFISVGGCDSVVQLNLTVNPLPNVSVTINGNQLEATNGFVSYLWYFNGLPISGATSNTYIPTQAGNYYVEVIDSNGCENLSAIVNYNPSTGIKEDLVSNIEIYPNPSREYVWIKTPIPTQVIITELSGRKIMEFKIENEIKLDLSELSNGIYLVQYLNNKGAVGSQKLVVNK